MADRYTKIFELESNFYIDCSPVLIRAGVVLLDSNTGKLLLQLKLENVWDQQILAVFVDVKCFNIANKSIAYVKDFQYLDLTIDRNMSFGERTPIILADNTIRRVEIIVMKVIFNDGQIWDNQNSEISKPFTQLIALDTIGSSLVEQLERDAKQKGYYSFIGKYKPILVNNYWFCACGALNKSSENFCSHCNISKNWIFENSMTNVLETKLHEYHEQIKEEKAKAKAKEDKERKNSMI